MKILSVFLGILLISCSPHRQVLSTGDRGLAREVVRSGGPGEHQWGAILLDPKSDEVLYQRSSDQAFTPASNMKIFTLLACLNTLSDSTEALRYVMRGDSLIFWGTGDPSLFYEVPDSARAIEFLRDHQGPMFYAPGDGIPRYGPGWAWDDFNYSFQVERSLLPVYGNRVWFSKLSLSSPGIVRPQYFAEYIYEDSGQERFVERAESANTFSINPQLIDEVPYRQSVPFVVSDYDIVKILSAEIGKEVDILYEWPRADTYITVPGSPLDSLYRRMMHQSDNFIAEQLLVQCAMQNTRDQAPDIDGFIRNYLLGFPGDRGSISWRDGSGLSRYNLVTPRSIARALDSILTIEGEKFCREVFPEGGKTGTLAERYFSNATIYAKTGSLSNRYCLSGYIETRSGRLLVFSFMHSNFKNDVEGVKTWTGSILNYIQQKY